MKHLDLRPVADSCKKMLYKGCLFVGLLAACGLTACSDEDESVAAPVFPELQSISCNAGETKEFTFEANTNWSLASSEIWCKLVQNDTESFVLSGSAGTQTVSVRVTDEASSVDAASVAKLELTMGLQTVVIGEVVRSAKGSEMKIYDVDGNEIEYLTVGYSEYVPFKVKANFHFAVTGTPGWVQVEGGSLVGTSNQEVQGGLQVLQDGSVEKYPVTLENNEVIVFSAEDGKASFSFPVVYAGMDPMAIEVTAPSTNRYNWVVSNDGKTFMQESGQGSTSGSATYVNRIPFTVKTLNDDYVFVYMEEWEDYMGNKNIGLVDPSMQWMHCEGEKGDIALRVDKNEPLYAGMPVEDRTGYVLAFSSAEYDTIKDNLEGNIVENGDIKYEYQQSNLLIQITQKELETGSADVQLVTNVTDNMMNPVDFAPYTGANLSHYQSTYGVQSVTEINNPAANTLITLAFEIGNIQVYDLETESELPTAGIEPAGTYMSVNAGQVGKKDIFVVVSEWVETGTPKSAMVILHLSNVEEGGGEEETSDCPFSIMNAAMGSEASCTQYTGVSLDWLTGNYGVESIWQVEKPQNGSLDVAMKTLGGTIKEWSCYDFYTDTPISLNEDEIMDVNGDGSVVNIWIGGAFVSNDVVFVVITDNTGAKYGLIVGTPVES